MGQKHIYNGMLRQLLRRENTDNVDSTSTLSSRVSSMETSESVEPWIELVKHKAAILSEAATFDMGHDSGALGAMYNSIYNGALYQHTTSGDEKIATKTEMQLLSHPISNQSTRPSSPCLQLVLQIFPPANATAGCSRA